MYLTGDTKMKDLLLKHGANDGSNENVTQT